MVTYQERVARWIVRCFDQTALADRVERRNRFGEEAIELLQAAKMPKEHVLELVDYVYARPVGDVFQEVGGVLNTLAGLCTAHDVDLDLARDIEMDRIETPAIMEKVRQKWLRKPRIGPLPGQSDWEKNDWAHDLRGERS